jgi:transcriptional regulator with XRE-family HTH domain
LSDENVSGSVASGRRLRQLREAKGLSMRDLADRLADGTHFTTIGKIETGKVRLTADRIEQLANALEVTFAEIANPNYAISQMRPVPVVKPGTWMRTGEVDKAPKIGWVISPKGGPKSVAFFNLEYMPGLERQVDGYSVVDTDDKELVEGCVYMLDTARGDSLEILVFRSNPPRFNNLVGPSINTVFAVGERPFTTVGRIIFEGKNL